MTCKRINNKYHRRLQHGYKAKRNWAIYANPLEDFEGHVASYARLSKRRMRNLCDNLLDFLANPAFLEIGLEKLDHKSCVIEKLPTGFIESEEIKWRFLKALGRDISDGKFKPGKSKLVNIPNIGKLESQWIEVPPIESRIVARTVTKLLTPILDPDFYPLSIGCRPNRGLHDGLAAASGFYQNGMNHVVCVNIRDAFDSIAVKHCFHLLERLLYKSPIVPLVKALNGKKRSYGLAQGIACSPLLLNVFLDHFLDQWWIKLFGKSNPLIRFVDEIVVFCRSREEAVYAFEVLANRLKFLRFSFNETQADSVKCLDSGNTALLLGFQPFSVSGELMFGFAERTWDKIELCFARAKNKKSAGFILDLDEKADDVIASWIYLNAHAIDQRYIDVVLDRLCELAAKYELPINSFGIDEAEYVWERGNIHFNKSKKRLQEWICHDPLGEKDFIGMN